MFDLSMSGKDFFGYLSLVVSIIGYAPYFVTTLSGKTKPHMFTWVIWAMAVGLAFIAQVSRQAGPGAWVTGCAVVACVALAALSIRYGEKNITRSDEVVFGIALAAIPLWAITKEPLWSVALMSFINVLGFVPTYRKAYADPFGENAVFYHSCVAKFTLGILALDHYSLVTVLFPLCSIVVNSLFLGMLYHRRRRRVAAGVSLSEGGNKGLLQAATGYSVSLKDGFLPPPLPKPVFSRLGDRGIFSALRLENGGVSPLTWI